MSTSIKVALAMPEDVAAGIFPPRVLDALDSGADLLSREPMTEFTSPQSLALLAEAEALITGWGTAMIDAAVLDAAPNLRYILHSAGTVKYHVGEACWERGIQVSTAADANSVPVAEYTVAMVILANKRVLQVGRKVHAQRTMVHAEAEFPSLGNYNKRVGIIGASKIGRHVMRLLAQYELEVVLADPFVSDAEATALGASKVTLEELCATSDVVSLHAPSLPSTRNMINAELIAGFKSGATFINTARGEIVDQDALLARIQRGDLYAVLDVTTPWDLPPDSGLFTHPNVLLTPHMAGSLGTELERMAMSTVAEAHRLGRGEPLKFRLPPEQRGLTA
ncbi:phosphoglycerate dehydrogenase-like enzyme [Arthrobacter stackebrandtii]|uniref:Phosphoglycerate dehydrogenase-like enzyme n=1 Tax=Arthrobacter stackebrandtii TaxID=272161 RepID=A0ABS4Z1Y9_9MICC|nr:hydroxyacid dehydrogenase [Arthrobacter stackebrandtii]MBP2414725.1 phosphoglycerate dehydrogenase-like enzyme [Arthrobacter stackebrandtii]PYH01809.1 hydroxyacid dehydrogenase [Arthrobacter stackebrandtii]